MLQVVAQGKRIALIFGSEYDLDVVMKMLRRIKKFKKQKGQSYPGVAVIVEDPSDERGTLRFMAAVDKAVGSMRGNRIRKQLKAKR